VATLPWKLEAVGAEDGPPGRPGNDCAANEWQDQIARPSTMAHAQCRTVFFLKESGEIKIFQLTAKRYSPKTALLMDARQGRQGS
jgi:hypothetical protein